MRTEYEIRNVSGRDVRGMVAGRKLCGGSAIMFAEFREAQALLEAVPKGSRGLACVHLRRRKPDSGKIKRMRLAELRALCDAEGLESVGIRNTLVKRLIETEVRH